MEKKHIVFLIPSFEVGGIERSFINLANRVSEEFTHVGIWHWFNRGPLKSDINLSSVETKFINGKRLVKLFSSLVREFRTSKPDIVVTPMYMIGMVAIISKIFSTHKPKLVIGCRNTFSVQTTSAKRFLDKCILPILYKIFYKRVDLFIAISKGVANDLKRSLSNKINIKVIYNPVIDKRINEFKSSSILINKESNTKQINLVSVGRLEPQKGMLELIDLFYFCYEEFNLHLTICGQGSLNIKLQEKINKYNLNSRIKLVGFSKNYLTYLSEADFFVANSQYEGFQNVIVEAMFFGTIPIVSDCPHGPSEILNNGEFGYLFSINSKEAFKQCFNKALTKINDKNFRDKISRRANYFNSERSATAYLEEFKRLLNI